MMIELSSEVMPIESYISYPQYSDILLNKVTKLPQNPTSTFYPRHQSCLSLTPSYSNVQTLQHRIHLPEMRPLRRHKMARRDMHRLQNSKVKGVRTNHNSFYPACWRVQVPMVQPS